MTDSRNSSNSAGSGGSQPTTDSFFRPSSLAATADKVFVAPSSLSASTASPFRLGPPRLPVSSSGGATIGASIGATSAKNCNGGGGANSSSSSSATNDNDKSTAGTNSGEAAGGSSEGGNYFSRFVRPLESGGASSGSGSGYVFGENLSSRVVQFGASASPLATFADAACSSKTSDSGIDASGAAAAADLSIGAQRSDIDSDAKETVDSSQADGKSEPVPAAAKEEKSASALKASAEKYELERRQQQESAVGEFSQVAVVTGEEGEENVLRIPCRVFVFDAASKSWVERGRAFLRLNDRQTTPGERGRQPLKSRLICRSQGGLKVIINTMLWPEMSVELVGEPGSSKRLRISVQSIEEGESAGVSVGAGLRVCLLVLNSVGDAQLLNSALQSRLQHMRSFAAASSSGAGVKRRANEPLTAPGDDSSDDKNDGSRDSSSSKESEGGGERKRARSSAAAETVAPPVSDAPEPVATSIAADN
ncbi:hypothetical protein BOX15_Mlig006677g1 [Macrostomum lignano]|uniref:Uncharacterized protein n=2 Tax=Macrostomum lignano TaxID=282301 RepID=A0A267ER03_9PLAT|nr:hypothetical protein BOX15_Mlig006677g1 [Macrostomum lignano]